MKKLGVLLALFFVLAFALPSAHGAGEQKSPGKKEATIQMVVVTQPEGNHADTKEKCADKLVDFYKSLTSNTLTFAEVIIGFTGVVIAIFATISALLVFKGNQINKEARKELEEIYGIKESIYKLKDSTHEHLDRAEKSIDEFVKDSKKQIRILIAQSKKDLKEIREEAKGSAKEAKSSEKKSKATEYFMDAYRLSEQGKYEEAIAAYGKAIELDLKDPAAYNNKANALDGLGRYAEAIDAYDKAIELDPEDAELYANKASSLIAHGKCEEAIVVYDKAIELDPKLEGVFNGKGYALISLSSYDDAIIWLKRALELQPNDRSARINMALALQKRNKPGDADEAKAILNNIIKENEKDDDAARAYAMLGEREKMLALVKTLVAEKPHLKLRFRTELEFEAYWDDSEFNEIVGG
jgi:tetratricopeptide (TPR) repeat protein